MSSENIHNLPADLELVGQAVMSPADITIKAFLKEGSHPPFANGDGHVNHLVQDKEGKLLAAKTSELGPEKSSFNLYHSVNCLIKAKLFKDTEFTKKFNYMKKYARVIQLSIRRTEGNYLRS